jgi:hypothetical protein
MPGRFNEEKATQMAALLLQLAGGRMYYLKLMKLMYLIDREGLLRWGWSMTNDRYISMDNGLVLSRVLNLMTEETLSDSYWTRFISPPLSWQVELLAEPDFDELSEAEAGLIKEQYDRFHRMFGSWGAKDRWRLVEFTHNLPEWKNPRGSSIPVKYEEVLRGANVPQEKIDQILQSLKEFNDFERALQEANEFELA